MALIQQAMNDPNAAQGGDMAQARNANEPMPQDQGKPTGNEATPEEQQNYEKVVLAGMKVLYDKTTHQAIMQKLSQEKDDPAKALSDVTTLIVTQLDQKSGGKIPQVVILPAAAEIMSLVAELAQKAGIFQVDDRVMGLAMQNLVMGLAEQYGADPEEIKSLMDSVGQDEARKMAEQQGALHQGAPQPAPQQGMPQTGMIAQAQATPQGA